MKNRAWAEIVAGGAFETAWALTMKLSDQFTDPLWTAATLILLGCSTVLLDQALKHNIPVGIGYSVWVGIGAVGSIVMGAILYGEVITAMRAVFAALIIGGVVGLQLSHKDSGSAPAPGQKE